MENIDYNELIRGWSRIDQENIASAVTNHLDKCKRDDLDSHISNLWSEAMGYIGDVKKQIYKDFDLEEGYHGVGTIYGREPTSEQMRAANSSVSLSTKEYNAILDGIKIYQKREFLRL